MKKTIRTISGVTPVAVMTAPAPCPGHCIYCPTFSVTPQSYTPESPAVIRARHCNYDPAKQVEFRLHTLSEMGHPVDKIEMIIMGGTFLATDVDYQYQFVKGCFDALNGVPSSTLAEAQKLNETAIHRCTGLCIETRPDWCGPEEVKRMLDFGATRVEIGVQTLDDDIYRLVRRGHTVADVIKATRLLKDYGFKVYYHWMPGLPGSNPQKDLELTHRLWDEEAFRPDGLKIYPTVVVEGTELDRWHQAGKYEPYDLETVYNVIADIKCTVPEYVRIPRVLRDIPARFINAGAKDSLRLTVKNRMAEQGKYCHCIRCREYGHRVRNKWKTGKPALRRLDYDASGGREVFLSFEDDNGTLFGLLRLRLKIQEPESVPFPAVIRELHVFGPEVPLSQNQDAAAQHKGLGKALLAEAERIACEEFRMTNIAVLSGVGAREYYRSDFGYEAKGNYMVKQLSRLPLAGVKD